ncbi:MAG: 5'-nucleotidase [Roseburia sp.]|nr:5'-nucleotidase [Roseburia sp.]MCM1279763.1 5'-nucleotidase [Robinsoniella sp.]
MAYSLKHKLVVGVSSRALFDLSRENQILESEGMEAYCQYQVAHESEILLPGPGFSLIRALLRLNELPGNEGRVEVIIMSRSSTDASLRIFHSIRHYGLPITRAVLSGGGSLCPYLEALEADLFLSANEEDVQSAIDCGIAAGMVINGNIHTYGKNADLKQIRIAFDGDAVLFTDESEKLFQKSGLEAFEENERKQAWNPLPEGPFAKFLKTISEIQKEFSGQKVPIRTALVTSRCAPAHERVIRTLRAWNVRVDEAYFLGGISKKDVLKAFDAQIFFDDQMIHALAASEVVPSARVPYKNSA